MSLMNVLLGAARGIGKATAREFAKYGWVIRWRKKCKFNLKLFLEQTWSLGTSTSMSRQLRISSKRLEVRDRGEL